MGREGNMSKLEKSTAFVVLTFIWCFSTLSLWLSFTRLILMYELPGLLVLTIYVLIPVMLLKVMQIGVGKYCAIKDK
jgi:hypothetical protein